VNLHDILKVAHKANASDIHLVAGQPPVMRVNQVMTPMDFPVISPASGRQVLEEMAPAEAVQTFDRQKDADFSYEIEGLSRYRVNAHLQRGAVGLCLRAIKTKVPPLSALTLPEVIARLTYLPRGLVLVTGDTGSGKSTTLAAMIQAMNERYRKHIITLEDPVEYTFESDHCLIEQRELGQDMPTFSSGLKHALRQDPDIILVGEIRDLETAQIAVQASLTGHLVLSTLHTNDAPSSIVRLIDLGLEPFLLTATIEGIVAQRLVRKINPAAREAYQPTEEELMELGLRLSDVEGKIFYRPRSDAEYGGYKGRMALFEIMTMDDTIRDMVMREESLRLVREHSRAKGMRSLRESGLLAIYEGQTSIDEVVRETLVEE